MKMKLVEYGMLEWENLSLIPRKTAKMLCNETSIDKILYSKTNDEDVYIVVKANEIRAMNRQLRHNEVERMQKEEELAKQKLLKEGKPIICRICGEEISEQNFKLDENKTYHQKCYDDAWVREQTEITMGGINNFFAGAEAFTLMPAWKKIKWYMKDLIRRW